MLFLPTYLNTVIIWGLCEHRKSTTQSDRNTENLLQTASVTTSFVKYKEDETSPIQQEREVSARQSRTEALVFKAEAFVMRMWRCATRQKEPVVITANNHLKRLSSCYRGQTELRAT